MTTLLLVLVAVFALDRAAKALAFRKPGLGRAAATAHAAPSAGILAIRPARNARPWAWPGGRPRVWIPAFALALAAALLLVQLDPLSGPLAQLGLGAALGGALGNLYDRVRHGAVLDFLTVGRLSHFNPADVAILLGLLAVLVARVIAATQLGVSG